MHNPRYFRQFSKKKLGKGKGRKTKIAHIETALSVILQEVIFNSVSNEFTLRMLVSKEMILNS